MAGRVCFDCGERYYFRSECPRCESLDQAVETLWAIILVAAITTVVRENKSFRELSTLSPDEILAADFKSTVIAALQKGESE